MKIAILGTRGIPAGYGGFETFAEECSAGLVQRGHDVTVYGRSHYVQRSTREHRGVRLVVLPTLRTKYTDTIVHTFLSVLHAVRGGYDALLFCNAANSVFALLPRLLGIPSIVNVDGIERKRQKWNRLGKAYYRISERLSVAIPDAIVTDARVIESYYRQEYGAESVFIPCGTITERASGRQTLDRLGLQPGGYYLYVSRLEPENHAHTVVAAFEKVSTVRRLVLVGDAPYSRDYIERLRRTQDPRILFPGAIYGSGYRELQANAYCYIHATEVGGTHPALVEAMGQGNLILANGTPENREVLGGTGILYRTGDASDLAERIREADAGSEQHAALKRDARERALRLYSWDQVVLSYEDLLTRVVSRRTHGR